MNDSDTKMENVVRLLKWIRQYPGWWYLICTPEEEHINLEMMRQLLHHLEKEAFYEIIFVLLTVHQNASFMKEFHKTMWLDCLIKHWKDDRTEVSKEMLQFFT